MTDKKHDVADEEQQDHVTQNETAEREEQEEVSHAPAEETQDVSDDTDKSEPSEAPTVAAPPLHPKHRLAAFLKTKKGKVIAAVAAVILILAVLLAVPFTRYAVLGTVVKKDVSLTVLDNKTGKPVSEVEVTLANRTNKTDQQGKVEFKNVAVGEQKAVLKKKYYKDASQTVLLPIFTAPKTTELKIEATGRQVPVKVLNKISGKPIEKAIVSALDTAVTTDEKGEAMLVLPADKTSEKGTVKLQGYNDLSIDIEVTELADKNSFSLTPSGKLYFLSKRTGKINVMKSNLDGSEAQVVVAGTGKEEDGGTILLASRDWRYLALKAKRDNGKPKLYLIDTSNDKMSVIDEGDVKFDMIGWYEGRFMFKVVREKLALDQPKREALKSYDATTGKLSTLDETTVKIDSATSYTYETFGTPYILENLVLYIKNAYPQSRTYYLSPAPTDLKSTLNSIKPDGSNKKSLKTFANNTVSSRIYAPDEVIVSTWDTAANKDVFFEYEHGKIKDRPDLNQETVYGKYYPTHLISPSAQRAFWYEPRDGKNTLLVGTAKGEDGKEVATLTEYTPYGWYSDDYLLVSKEGSELYILSRENTNNQPLKVTDYHKPSLDFSGYGYGYGGF